MQKFIIIAVILFLATVAWLLYPTPFVVENTAEGAVLTVPRPAVSVLGFIALTVGVMCGVTALRVRKPASIPAWSRQPVITLAPDVLLALVFIATLAVLFFSG